MSDLDRYLLPTEVAEVVVRRHWASQVGVTAMYLGITILTLGILSVLPASHVISVVCGVLLLASAAWFVWQMLDWRSERFVITDKRVLLINGLLTRRVAIMPLSKVTDLTYERSLVGRVIGFGTFVMESAGQHQALSRIEFLPLPDQLYKRVSGLLFGARGPYGRHFADRHGYPTEQLPLDPGATGRLPRESSVTDRMPMADQRTDRLPRIK